jgi:transposase
MPPSSFPAPISPARIFLYAKNVDMRKSFDGLHALVQAEFQRDIRLGDLFLFLNRRLDRIKLLHWDGDDLVIWMKPNRAK